MSKDGALFRWSYTTRPGGSDDELENQSYRDSTRWRIVDRHYFMQNNAKVNCAAYHASTNLLVVGFSNGIFGLYDLPDFNMIHTLRYVLRYGLIGYSLNLLIKHFSE